MVKVNNIFGDEYSGAVGTSGVFAKWKGIQYRRKWAKPANPKTSKQVDVRTSFGNAIDEWHLYNTLQKQAFNYLAAGKGMSGFNLLVQRWQKDYLTTRTVRPSYGAKTIGSALTFQNEEPVGDAAQEVTITKGAGKVISMDDETPSALQAGAVVNGVTPTGVKAWIDLEMGQIRIVTAATNKYWISYMYGGNQILAEPVTENNTDTETKQTKYFPIDYQSVVLHDKATAPTDLTDSPVLGGEVDILNGKLYATTSAKFATSSTCDYTLVTVLEDAKVEVEKANSSFVAFRGYSDANGMVKVALSAQDENYDTDITKTGYDAMSKISQAAATAAKNESIILS
jgi:hypothetical protein